MKKVCLLFMTAVMFMSCSKDEKPDTKPSGCYLSTIHDANGGGKYDLKYNQEGLVSLVKLHLDDDVIDYKITYEKERIVVDLSDTRNNKYLGQNVYTLTNGLVSKVYYNEEGSKSEEVFEYTDGFLSKIKNSRGFNKNLTYKDGNLTKVEIEGAPYNVKYEYDLSLPYVGHSLSVIYSDAEHGNLDDNDIYPFLYEQGFFGKRPKNRIVATDITKKSIEYKFDSKNNLQSILYSDVNDSEELSTFNYSCN